MTSTINWRLRDLMWAFREPGDGRDTRLAVLLNLILHSNQRNRAWPGEELIAKETGFNVARVSAAINWLFDHGAIYNVPFRFRVGPEADMEPRKYVYQITGLIRLNNETIPYLYDSDDAIEGMIAELRNIDGESVVNLLFSQVSDSEGSDSEGSDSENKGSTVLKGSKLSKATTPRIIIPTFDPDKRALAARGADEQRVDNENSAIQDPLTALEQYILAETGQQSIAESYRTRLASSITWVKEESHETVVSESPNTLFESDPLFAQFVREEITTRLKNDAKKKRFTAKGYTDSLCAPGTYRWFFEGYKAERPATVKSSTPAADPTQNWDWRLRREEE